MNILNSVKNINSEVERYSWFISQIEDELNRKFGENTNDIILCYWDIGEYAGGNCWGESPSYQASSQSEPVWWGFQELLKIVAPNLLWTDYLDVRRKTIHETDIVESGYYGNKTFYKVLYFRAKDLLEELKSVATK
jgi:hypothetical protein